eukprot:1147342-Pelagomonas_calceolata.AAC.7
MVTLTAEACASCFTIKRTAAIGLAAVDAQVKWGQQCDNTGRYSGVLDCFAKTAKTEGLPAFYRGEAGAVLHACVNVCVCVVLVDGLGSCLRVCTLQADIGCTHFKLQT